MGILNNSLHVTLLPGEQNICSHCRFHLLDHTPSLNPRPSASLPYTLAHKQSNVCDLWTMRSGKETEGLENFHHMMRGTNVIFTRWGQTVQLFISRHSWVQHMSSTRNCGTWDGNFSVWRHCAAHHVMRVFQAFSLLTIVHGSKVMRINFRKEGEGLGLRLHTPRCAI